MAPTKKTRSLTKVYESEGFAAESFREERVRNEDVEESVETAEAEVQFDGVIFLCINATEADCFTHHVFGLPETKKSIVKKVNPGMALFLFNVDQKCLHGIYTATLDGAMNLVPRAFQGKFPAQVLFVEDVDNASVSLQESEFIPAIEENYITDHKFRIELSSEQVGKLERIFRQKELENIDFGMDSPSAADPLINCALEGRHLLTDGRMEADRYFLRHPSTLCSPTKMGHRLDPAHGTIPLTKAMQRRGEIFLPSTQCTS
ncbi:hypothetical protein GOP47_0011225 [Adiantum capillus-veneris]|uniref:DCD domain-containing protein n=1 Tax=Adiantum capillus-veneris TaxID=13818 RepID=A0A9D4UTI4_ADICA|nr:hypothetical protein GOP47_0011225 [Adiantum capillus-veneris]